MDEQKKTAYLEKFNRDLHLLGRLMLILGMVVLVGFAFVVGLMYDAMPNLNGFLMGVLYVGMIFF